MSQMQWKPGTKVKLSPSILENESRKQSHFFFKQIIDSDMIGEVEKRGKEKYVEGVWVKFTVGKVLAPDEDFIPV